MLHKLYIENLILLEKAEIDFSEGFTAITGETGAGKTALVHGLSLLLGGRADFTKMRKGAEKTVVEGHFTGGSLRRELYRGGKSKAFFNQSPISLAEMQHMAPSLLRIVDQHSHIALREETTQLEFLDLVAEAEPFLSAFQDAWETEKKAEARYRDLKKKAEEKQVLLIGMQEQKEELEKAELEGCDEKGLFEEYEALSAGIEKGQQTQEMLQTIDEQLLPTLKALRPQLPLEGLEKNLKNALFSLEEASLQLSSFQSSLEQSPNRLAFLEERLEHLAKLKKKYGKTIEELASYQNQLDQDISELLSLDQTLPEAENAWQMAAEEANQAAKKLSDQRMKAAEKLGPALSHLLRQLNMQSAEVAVVLSEQSRTSLGDEKATFFLKANQGENLATLAGNISGGELARLLFALIILLAEKNPSSTLFFDEIDSGVGGETASLMGEKLLSLSSSRQVLSITHFSQVAKKAGHHIGITKEEKEGRTRGKIKLLSPQEREEELRRMEGKLFAETK